MSSIETEMMRIKTLTLFQLKALVFTLTWNYQIK